ncbi:hypothetical protein [Pseudomonas sp. 1152_12]|uniref:hypothetical protein n=1 Tax=Pseudomonas sp. 1152_12 TaxID=2604455 RepID=UPI00406468B8
MQIQSDELGNVAVSIDPAEQVNILTQNNTIITTNIVALSEDKTSIITASGDQIKIDEIVNISPPIATRTAKFFGGIVLDIGDFANTVAGGQGNSHPPLTFTYINGIKVPLKK